MESGRCLEKLVLHEIALVSVVCWSGGRQTPRKAGISRAGGISFSRLAAKCLSRRGGGASEADRDLFPEAAR
jgi:hypothetical protein